MNKNSTNTERAVLEIEKLIKDNKGLLSIEEAVVSTGFSPVEVRGAMVRLLELYKCRVEIDSKTASPFFHFQFPLKATGSKSFREVMYSFFRLIWKVFRKTYMRILGLIILSYSIIFFFLIFSRTKGRGRRGSLSSESIQRIVIFLKLVLAPDKASQKDQNTIDEYLSGISDKKREQKFDKKDRMEFFKNILPAFHEFAFGPINTSFDEKDNEKEALSFIHKNNGYINASNIIELSGCSFGEAESRLARYSLKYNGDLSISPYGYPIAFFRQIAEGQIKASYDKSIIHYIEEKIPDYYYFGNYPKIRAIPIAMNIFNLLVSFFIYSNSYFQEESLNFILGIVPFCISSLFFIIPVLRFPASMADRLKLQKQKSRQNLISLILKNPESPDIDEYIRKRSHSKMLQELLIELQGEMVLDEKGNALPKFERLGLELNP